MMDTNNASRSSKPNILFLSVISKYDLPSLRGGLFPTKQSPSRVGDCFAANERRLAMTSSMGVLAQVLIMLLDPAKPKHLVFLRHLDEVPQAFLELFGSFVRSVNEGDAKGATAWVLRRFPLLGVFNEFVFYF